jgi:hypothetical protein
MTPLILPGRYARDAVARELHERTLSFRADVQASIVTDDSDPLLTEYTRRLQAVDPRLMLVRALENVVPGVPMRPGYYHLMVDNGLDAPLSVTVIEGEGGEFCEPTSRVFEKLFAGDMRERRNLDRWERAQRDEFDANERELQRDNEERRDHLRELVDAYTRTSISTTTARPWTQNNQPNAQRDAGARR